MRTGRIVVVCLSVNLVVAATAPVSAQDTPPDAGAQPPPIADRTLVRPMAVDAETVFGASRYARRVTDAPASITSAPETDLRFHVPNTETIRGAGVEVEAETTWRHAEMGLATGNLSGRRYADPGADEHPTGVIPQDGRTVWARFSWHF